MVWMCRRGLALWLLSLSLLSFLSVLFTASRVRETLRVTHSNYIRGGNPLINSHVRNLEAMERAGNLATEVMARNAEIKPQQEEEEEEMSKGERELLRLNESNARRQLNRLPTPLSIERPPRSLRLRLGETRGLPPAMWRGRELGAEARKLRQMFPLSSNFTFPNPQISLPLAAIDRSQWLLSLRRHMASLSGRHIINLVTSNSQYQDVLLNWLISAVVRSGLELDSILVVSMDVALHTRLLSRGIPSVSVPLSKLIRRDTNFTKAFDRVMMLRLAVMRLLSHWGFDIHNYDTDAVLLRDPQPLYDRFPESHMIGSVGRIPRNLMAKWGITICIGVVIIRGCPRIEEYWEAVSKSCESSLDDQEKLNCGLEDLEVEWDNADSDQNTTVVSGRCGNGLEVRVLPFGEICRLETCDPAHRGSYYVWHKGGSRTRRDKVKGSREGRTWFLQYKWSGINNQLRGRAWLESIAYWKVTHS